MACGCVRDERRLAAGENQVEWVVTIDDPTLWWPHALGDQPLHDVAVEVTPHPDGAGGPPEGAAPSHRVTRRIGLRQLALRGWVLHVNGERLFLKGANQGPTRMALAEATAADLGRDVQLAKDANLDLLRVHAHVSRPELYDAADEAGMLLWQDFPLQGAYARTIRKQAQRQSRGPRSTFCRQRAAAWNTSDRVFGGMRAVVHKQQRRSSHPDRWRRPSSR